MNREQIISRVLAFCAWLIGTNYSQNSRLKPFRGGSLDCSSLMWAAWLYAGFPLQNAAQGELTYSAAQADAEGFNLIYPASRSQIGQLGYAKTSLITSYGAMPGDIVLYSFNFNSPRWNKVTHIGMYDGNGYMIHTANNKEKLCRVPLAWGAKNVVAILRLKQDATPIAMQPVRKGSVGKFVRMFQVCANRELNATLTMDGEAGTKTDEATRKMQSHYGAPVDGEWSVACWNKVFGEAQPEPKPVPVPEPSKSNLPEGVYYFRLKTTARAYLRSADKKRNENIIKTLNAGVECRFRGEAANGFYKVSANGIIGYVHTSLLKPYYLPKSDAVESIQGVVGVPRDRVYGKLTALGVQTLQRVNDIVDDCIWGNDTRIAAGG